MLLLCPPFEPLASLLVMSVHPSCLQLVGEGSAISLLHDLAFQVLACSFVTRPLFLDPFHPLLTGVQR